MFPSASGWSSVRDVMHQKKSPVFVGSHTNEHIRLSVNL